MMIWWRQFFKEINRGGYCAPMQLVSFSFCFLLIIWSEWWLVVLLERSYWMQRCMFCLSHSLSCHLHYHVICFKHVYAKSLCVPMRSRIFPLDFLTFCCTPWTSPTPSTRSSFQRTHFFLGIFRTWVDWAHWALCGEAARQCGRHSRSD